MREDVKTVRSKYQEFSLPEAITKCFEKFSAEIDFEFRKLKPLLVEQYTAQPLSEEDITKLDPLNSTKIEDLPNNLSNFINNLVLTVQQTSIAELIRRRSPDRPKMSSVGHARSTPSNLEQLKTTVAKLTAEDNDLKKTISVGKVKLLEYATAGSLTAGETRAMQALQKNLKSLTSAHAKLRNDLDRNQDHLLHFDKVEGRRWEDENVRLRGVLEKTENAWGRLGEEIQQVVMVKGLSVQDAHNLQRELETANERVTRYNRMLDKVKGWQSHPSTRRQKYTTDQQVADYLKVVEYKLEHWGTRRDDSNDAIQREEAIRDENQLRREHTLELEKEYAKIEKEVHRISAALEKHAGEKPSPLKSAPSERVGSEAVRDHPSPPRPSLPATPAPVARPKSDTRPN